MSPYSAKASPKMSTRISPTKSLSCWAFALIPTSPTIPIVYPAALIRTNIYHTTKPTNQAWRHMFITIMIRVLTFFNWVDKDNYSFDSEWQPRSFRKYREYRPWRRESRISWRRLASRWKYCWFPFRPLRCHRRRPSLNIIEVTCEDKCNGDAHETEEWWAVLEIVC